MIGIFVLLAISPSHTEIICLKGTLGNSKGPEATVRPVSCQYSAAVQKQEDPALENGFLALTCH